MTKEVSAFEVASIPTDKEAIRKYIERAIEACRIQVYSFFGFVSYADPPGYKHRIGGWGEGRWVSVEEARYIEYFRVRQENEKGSGLFDNEADASLAVHACTGKIVLTAERKNKSGPLKKAARIGGWIVYLREYDPREESLRCFILRSVAGKPVPIGPINAESISL